MAFLLDEPRLINCFSFTAKAADEPLQDITANAEIRVLSDETPIAGEVHDFRFELRDGDTDTPLSDIEDVSARIIQTGGSWNTSLRATPSADGAYSLTFTPPSPGIYSVLLAVPSLGIDLGTLPQIFVVALGSGTDFLDADFGCTEAVRNFPWLPVSAAAGGAAIVAGLVALVIMRRRQNKGSDTPPRTGPPAPATILTEFAKGP